MLKVAFAIQSLDCNDEDKQNLFDDCIDSDSVYYKRLNKVIFKPLKENRFLYTADNLYNITTSYKRAGMNHIKFAQRICEEYLVGNYKGTLYVYDNELLIWRCNDTDQYISKVISAVVDETGYFKNNMQSFASKFESFVNNVLKQVKHVAPELDKLETSDYVFFNNCDVRLSDGKCFVPNPHKRPTLTRLDCNYNPKKEYRYDLVKKFIKMYCLEDDKDTFEALCYMLGYCIMPTCKYDVFFVLYGGAGTGKTTMLRAIANMLGKRNCSAIPLRRLMNDKFAPKNLAGKLLNYSGEMSQESSPFDTSYGAFKNTDLFKDLVCGETMSCDVKYSNEIIFENKAKLVFGSNELPKFKNVKDDMMRRLIIIEFKKPIENPNTAIREDAIYKLKEHLAAFALRIAIKLFNSKENILKQYSGVGDKQTSATSRASTIMSDSVCDFIIDKELDDILSTNYTDLYLEYVYFCNSENVRPVTKKFFGRTIGNALALQRHVKRVDGKVTRGFEATSKTKRAYVQFKEVYAIRSAE